MWLGEQNPPVQGNQFNGIQGEGQTQQIVQHPMLWVRYTWS